MGYNSYNGKVYLTFKIMYNIDMITDPKELALYLAWSEGQFKDDALAQAEGINAYIEGLSGTEFGHGLRLEGRRIVSAYRKATEYLSDVEGNPVTFYHYRNMDYSKKHKADEAHPMMHFGTLSAAYAKAYQCRNVYLGNDVNDPDYYTNEKSLRAGEIGNDKAESFDGDFFLAVKAKVKNPFFMPDVGQTNFFGNRAVLYASGLFNHEEIDNELFVEEIYPCEDIAERVMQRLKERGYDSVAYINNVEDPGSLSLMILDAEQVEPHFNPQERFEGFRYEYATSTGKTIVECDKQGSVAVSRSSEPHPHMAVFKNSL